MSFWANQNGNLIVNGNGNLIDSPTNPIPNRDVIIFNSDCPDCETNCKDLCFSVSLNGVENDCAHMNGTYLPLRYYQYCTWTINGEAPEFGTVNIQCQDDNKGNKLWVVNLFDIYFFKLPITNQTLCPPTGQYEYLTTIGYFAINAGGNPECTINQIDQAIYGGLRT